MAAFPTKEQTQKLLAVIFILFLVFLIIKGLWRYIGAFFGTGILYVLFRGLNDRLRERTFLGRRGAAIITIVIALLIVIIPTFLIITVSVNQLSGIIASPQSITSTFSQIDQRLPGIDLAGLLSDQVPQISQYVTGALLGSINDITRITITLFITFFLLYFLLIEDEKHLEKQLKNIIPFNRKHTEKLMAEFKTITNATLLTAGLMALLQGFLLAIILLIFGIKAAIFWGLVGAFLSFLPVVGPALIWVPVVILELAQGHIAAGIIITAWGFLIANIDNLLRPLLNRRVGKINQVVSLLGIFMGIVVFGLIGIVVGPIILSFFLHTMRMFQEEYL